MYADTRPLGPIMELRVQNEQNALTHEGAAQAADYWRATAQQLLADPEAPAALNTRMAYAKMASEQAALLDYHHHARTAYRSASEIWPSCSEAVFRLTNLLIGQNRLEDAFPVAESRAGEPAVSRSDSETHATPPEQIAATNPPAVSTVSFLIVSIEGYTRPIKT